MSLPLSIIIPAYNEAERLGASLEIVIRYLRDSRTNAEIIVVDDGSSDATARIAEEIFARTPEISARAIRYEPNRGKGYAVRTGLAAASGEISLFSDADLSTPIEELTKLVEPIRAGEADVTFGSRALDRSLIGTHQPWRREQGGKVFNFVVKALTGLPFWDTQCGFKAFRMSVFRPLLQVMKIDRFGFDVEFLYAANLANLRLKEIAVRWNHCEGTKVSVLRDSRRMFNEVRLIRKNAKRGVYDPAIKAVNAKSIELSGAEAKI
ncbi:MAG TPA: dolichyl-phosphate beta-glucosyltransferase [Pyrinomonadaceae bacterium]|jgi:glycosyltransferase involved in cell wall biosynthesis